MKPKRKSLSPKMRKIVYDKYDGHCAYCGCEMELKDMQADHVEAVYLTEFKRNKGIESLSDEELNSLKNYMPACRQCNFYKSTMSIEKFRNRLIDTMMKNLQKEFSYRLAIKYGLIEEHINPIKFYFEVVNEQP